MPDEREYIEPEHQKVLEEHGWDVGRAQERPQAEPQIKIERGGRVLFGTPSELAEQVQRGARSRIATIQACRTRSRRS